jgi:hypothetical protein
MATEVMNPRYDEIQRRLAAGELICDWCGIQSADVEYRRASETYYCKDNAACEQRRSNQIHNSHGME